MKKVRLILLVLVFTSIVVIFLNNIIIHNKYSHLNKNVYDFLQDKGNRIDVYNASVKLNSGSSKNTCVYFLAEVLRKNDFSIPIETSNTEQMISLLSDKGFKKQSNYKKIMPGDICFTTNANGEQNGFPTHTYIFMKWVKAGSYDYAYICDNQAKDYKGKIYHIRNINIKAKYNGLVKDRFAFFMRKS
ncbi:hypothetical protein KPL37_07355 [Clostridium frigoris]|uniref:Bacteriophage lysin domain-containing protein n=1 Tax=Clostridium frigoris TaxID=205327 RepID=A0ABS6BT72_9CLOT|nr:hypothetical protein [Clostridium frigoris]MBU3159569.1 hypothetical protein [Clostridium frigoris]